MLDILHNYGLILLIGQYPKGPLGGLANAQAASHGQVVGFQNAA